MQHVVATSSSDINFSLMSAMYSGQYPLRFQLDAVTNVICTYVVIPFLADVFYH